MEESIANSELPRTSGKGNPFRIPVSDEHLADEIALQWSQRECFSRIMNLQKAEILRIDAVLGELFYRLKQKISKPGRNGAWSAFLKEHNIIRNTADRLALEHSEFYNLSDTREPVENRICQTAYRTSEGLENMLRSPMARMKFVRCLADFFELTVEFEGDSVRLSVPPSIETDLAAVPPNIIELGADGKVKPVNYELADDDGEGNSTPPPSSDEVL
jgi:hypothetical protein